VVDIETTGLARTARIVSVGLLVDGQIYVLFARSRHASVRNLPPARLRWALGPLAGPAVTVVMHNATFDLAHLLDEDIPVGGTVHDTLQMLRLLDQDRGGDGAGVRTRRRDLRAPAGAAPFADYRLKHCVPMLTGLAMVDFPGRVEDLPYREHVTYLASDLLGTRALYDHLVARLAGRPRLLLYHDALAAPLTPLLVAMGARGVAADAAFIRAECARLDALAAELAARHEAAHGVALGGDAEAARWLWGTLGLQPLPGAWKRQGGRHVPSLEAEHLAGLLRRHAHDPRVAGSLELVIEHRRARQFASRLGALLPHVGPDGRIHTTLVDRQATGRISSGDPGLQQLARPVAIAGRRPLFIPRSALVAAPGCELVAMDLAQADIRVLAHHVASARRRARAHLARLRECRLFLLACVDPAFPALHAARRLHRNPAYRGGRRPPGAPDYDPRAGSGLAAAFRAAAGDFYTVAATAMLGQPPRDKHERNHCKQTILGIVNGMGPAGLAKRLGCDERTARDYLARFAAAYPNEMAYRRMIAHQIALTGRVTTFAGRDRTDTAHRWLVARPRVTVLVTYRRGDRYWLDVTPLEPRLRVLTCYIHRAWDARPGPHRGALIYQAGPGILTPRDYRLYDQAALEYHLPVRNLAWRSIRRVRRRGEEAPYRGLDATVRALFNAICQGGTADLTKLMMLAAGPLLARHGAALLLQIHDELVFEVPRDNVVAFIREAVPALEAAAAAPGFAVPVVLEPKHGGRFGALAWRRARDVAGLRPPWPAVSRPRRRPPRGEGRGSPSSGTCI
jgi:DNA polymerase I-like protein with 3'-5' exonuclease and polymerase domains